VADGDSAFCGDGSDTSGPAAALDGKWLELFRPRKRTEQTDPSLKNLIQTGNFNQRHLVNLTKQKYTTEPNVRFSPDNEQVIFTSNMFGPSYVFAAAVDVAPTQAQPTTPSSDAATAP
jgi:oligogalacturonide lyase